MRDSFNICGICRRASRISLRGLLLGVLVLCLFLGAEARRLNRQRAAIAWVQSQGGVALYGWQLDERGQWTEKRPPYPRWLMEVLGPDCFQSIEAVDIYNAELADISPLSDLRDLEELHLNGNAIQDLGPLAELTQLRVLHLAYNRVDDLASLERLSNLETLMLDGNRVRCLQPVRGLRRLKTLTATDNRISDLRPLAELIASQAAFDASRETGLTYVDVRENPLDRQAVELLEQALPVQARLLTDAPDE